MFTALLDELAEGEDVVVGGEAGAESCLGDVLLFGDGLLDPPVDGFRQQLVESG